MSRISGNLNVDGNLNVWTSASITSSGLVSASDFRDYNYVGGRALVSDLTKNIVESSVTSAQINYLNTTSANIQTQLNDIVLITSNAVVKNPALSQTISGQPLYIVRDSTSNDAFGVRTTADELNRFLINHEGKHLWGDGTNARDTNLYRNGANGLKTDDIFDAGLGLRATGFSAPNHNALSGAGIEVHYTAGTGRILSYDRTNSTYLPTRLDGSQLQFRVSGTSIGTVSNTGVTFTNVSATGNFVNTTYIGNRVLLSNASKQIVESTTIDSTEIGYLNGVSANIQDQINQVKTYAISGSGAGTPNRIVKFITSSSMGDSHIRDDGSTIFFDSQVSGTLATFSSITEGGTALSSKYAPYITFTEVSNTSANWNSAYDRTENSRVGLGTYNDEDNLTLSARNTRGINFGRMFQSPSAPDQTNYFNYIQMPEAIGSYNQTVIATSITNDDYYFGRGVWNVNPTWRRVWTNYDFSTTNISNWNTAYANTHTHSNKSHLDTINQSLATTASPTFDSLTVGTLTTGPNKLSILGQYYAYTEYLTQFNGVNAGIDYSTNSFSFAHTDAAGNYIDTPLRISLDVGGELETTLPVVAPSHRFGTLTIPSYPYTLARGSYYYVWPKIQASGAAGTIYLPASPQAGDSFMIFATNGASGNNTVGIMSVSGNGKTIILTNNNTTSQEYGTASAVYMYVNTMFTYDGTYWYAFKGING